MLDSVKMLNFDWTHLDMLIKVPFWLNVVSLNMPRMALEKSSKFDFEKWARTMQAVASEVGF